MGDYQCYRIRVAYSWLEVHDALKMWDAVSKGMIVFQHNDANRVHCHIWLQDVDCSTDTLKNIFKKKKNCGNLGNKGWSFKSGDEDQLIEYLTYCSKGQYRPVFNSMSLNMLDPDREDDAEVFCNKGDIEGDFWDAIIDNWVTFTPSGVSQEKEKQRSKYDVVQEVIKAKPLMDDPHDVVKEIIRVLRDNKQCVGLYKIMDLYDSVMMYGDTGNFINRVANKISNRGV